MSYGTTTTPHGRPGRPQPEFSMKNVKSLFQDLFVFDMANNHMGDLDHGLKIINELHNITIGSRFDCALKFQYRDLDTFIHPEYKENFDFKYVKRFQETRLSDNALFRLKQEVDRLGFISMCTPFDENSVTKILKFDFDIIKIASCSFTDWPLLERIANTNKPIIASTAGAPLEEIDRVVVFFKHRRKQFAIMHCVGEYPTLTKHLNLNQIAFFKNRYSDVPIGYSTHENPDNLEAIKMAIAKGAQIFERHVGVKTEEYPLNAYSSTPHQIQKWLDSARQAFEMCGTSVGRREIYEKEKADLNGLMRGVFLKRDVRANQKISMEDTFFAIPKFDGQIAANDMSKYAEFVAQKDLNASDPVFLKDISFRDIRKQVLNIISKVKEMLVESKVHLPHMLQFELSHHYGLEKLENHGAIIINCVNRGYCKKLIIMLPGQCHPAHFHKRKEETFQILSGELFLDLGDGEKVYRPGNIVLVEQDVNHSFRSESGTIFEEISSTHYPDDSYYDDQEILTNKNRKTEMTFFSDWLYETLK